MLIRGCCCLIVLCAILPQLLLLQDAQCGSWVAPCFAFLLESRWAAPGSPTAEPVSHGGCVSQGAQLVFRHKEVCAFPGSRLSERQRLPGSLSGSDFNRVGWTLEATWWNDSQVTVRSQRAGRHTGSSSVSTGYVSPCQIPDHKSP